MDIILKEKKMKRSHLELAKQLIKDTNATLIECLKALNDTDGNFEKAKKF
jgi:translation elongation factor EF-Ts